MHTMRVLKIENGTEKEVNYPRRDNNPVIGLSEDIQFFEIVENKPVIDDETKYLEFTDYTLTEETGNDFTHLKIAYKNYSIQDKIINTEFSTEDKVKNLEELVFVLTKNEKDRTAEDLLKIEETKGKIKIEETKSKIVR